jgi:hypothetical protein
MRMSEKRIAAGDLCGTRNAAKDLLSSLRGAAHRGAIGMPCAKAKLRENRAAAFITWGWISALRT